MKTAFILILAVTCMTLGACWSSRNDGAGDLYKIIDCKQRGTC